MLINVKIKKYPFFSSFIYYIVPRHTSANHPKITNHKNHTLKQTGDLTTAYITYRRCS